MYNYEELSDLRDELDHISIVMEEDHSHWTGEDFEFILD